jgi:hypothetical protein
MRPAELRDEIVKKSGTTYDVDDILTATRHLAHHGYVRDLRSSSGEKFILLAPDLLQNLASSMVLEARKNPKGLGSLDEQRLLDGDYRFPELRKLHAREQEILLDAATTLFIEHNICFRTTLGKLVYLVFPSLINLKKPPVEDVPIVEETAYTVTGATENVYASLVVLLGYTNTFTRTDQWRSHAQYEMGDGQLCGFRLSDEREGEIDLVLYFGQSTASSTKILFQSLFEKFLLARDVTVKSFPPVPCAKCGYVQARAEVMRRQAVGTMFCSECGTSLQLPPMLLTPAPRGGAAADLEREHRVARVRTQFEKAITWLKAYLRDNAAEVAAPSCFISYARGSAQQERWIEHHLATDLRNAGIAVLLDRWHNVGGTSISRYIDKIATSDFVIMIGTKALREKYDAQDTDPVVGAELKLINTRLRKRSTVNETILPLLLEGTQASAFPPLAEDFAYFDFTGEESYFERLFEVLLKLYRIPFEDPAMRDLKEAIRTADRRR